MKKKSLILLVMMLTMGSCSEDDAPPVCLAPPSCGSINENRVNLTVLNETGEGYAFVDIQTDLADYTQEFDTESDMSCWINMGVVTITGIRLSRGNGDDDTISAGAISGLLSERELIQGDTYLLRLLKNEDNALSTIFSPYDPDCADTN